MTGKDKAFDNAHIGRRVHEGDWLLKLNTKLIEVTFFSSKGELSHEQHVDDCTTLPETVRMTMERMSAAYVIHPYMGRWCLVTPGREPTKLFRYYDTKEAAEMVAIHNG